MRKLSTITLAILISLLVGCSEPDKPSVALYLAVQRGDLDQLAATVILEDWMRQNSSN